MGSEHKDGWFGKITLNGISFYEDIFLLIFRTLFFYYSVVVVVVSH